MTKTSLKNIAESYYRAMAAKDIESIAALLYEDIVFSAPLAQTKGAHDFLEAVKGFMTAFDELTIHASFEEDNQAVVVYDLVCKKPVGKIRSVALIHFSDGLISRIELYYDPRPFLG